MYDRKKSCIWPDIRDSAFHRGQMSGQINVRSIHKEILPNTVFVVEHLLQVLCELSDDGLAHDLRVVHTVEHTCEHIKLFFFFFQKKILHFNHRQA